MIKLKVFLKLLFSIIFISSLVSCTESGDFYDKSKHKKEEYSETNTAALLLGGLIVAAAASDPDFGGLGGGGRTDYDWDWDYQYGNNRWVCRGIQTGRYAKLSKCAWDVKDDDRWPG